MRWRARTTTRLRRCTASIRRVRTWRGRWGKWKGCTRSECEGTMSVEIEVGLENATKVPRVTEGVLVGETGKGVGNPKVRGLLIAGGAVVAAAIAGLFFYYHNRETTDDAQVDGHITPMASKVYGRVAHVLGGDKPAVEGGQGLVKNGPPHYQAAMDQDE